MEMKIIDADGHVMEDQTLLDYLEEPYRSGSYNGGLIGPIRNVLGDCISLPRLPPLGHIQEKFKGVWWG